MKSKNRKLRSSDCHFLRREYASGGVAEPLCGSSGLWRWGFNGEWIGVDDRETAIQHARSIMAADHQAAIPQPPAPSNPEYEYTAPDVKCLRSEWPCGAIAEPIAGTPATWRWGIKDRWKIKWVELGSLNHCVNACENHYRNSASFIVRSNSNDGIQHEGIEHAKDQSKIQDYKPKYENELSDEEFWGIVRGEKSIEPAPQNSFSLDDDGIEMTDELKELIKYLSS